MATSDTLRDAFTTAMAELQRTLAGPEHTDALARVRDAALDLADELSTAEAVLEARDEQIATQVALLTQIELPLLQVSRTTLCVPLIGEFDAFRTTQILHGLLTAAIARRVTTVVLDLTAALFRDVSTALELTRVFQALRLVGVRGVLSGVQPGLAPWLTENEGPLRAVPCYADLASALAFDDPRTP